MPEFNFEKISPEELKEKRGKEKTEKKLKEERPTEIFEEKKEGEEWKEVVEDKIKELYNEEKVPLRFLNKEELFGFLKNKKIYSVEVARCGGDIQKFFEEGKKLGWSDVAHVLTNWKPEVGQPEFYSTLVKEFSKCYRKAKRLAKENKIDKEKIKETALRELRTILQNPEQEISEYYLPYVEKSIESAARILDFVELAREEKKFLKSKGKNFDEPIKRFEKILKRMQFSDSTKKFLRELLEKEVYPIEEKNLRDVLLKYSSLSSSRPYQAIMFIRESLFEPSKEYGFDWGWIKRVASLESALLGITVTIPDKKFLNEIQNEMLEETEDEPKNRVPIYDWRGNLVWPKRMKPKEIKEWVKQKEKELEKSSK